MTMILFYTSDMLMKTISHAGQVNLDAVSQATGLASVP